MLRLGVVGVALLALGAVAAAAASSTLPVLTLQDQEGRSLSLDALRGRVVVIVYGTRDGIDHHIEWGKRLDAALVDGGVYRAGEPPSSRPVRILAFAQMGGIPTTFRPVIRTFVSQRMSSEFSLYLDWEDRMSALFGAHRSLSTVVVGDREGIVRLIWTGLPKEDALRTVVEAIRGLT